MNADTPRTNAAKVDKGGMTFIWLEFAQELELELAASNAEVARLKILLSDLLILTEKNYWNSTNYKQIKEAINTTNK
jgi:hypothetical protein